MASIKGHASVRLLHSAVPHGVYKDAVNDSFGANIDYAQLIKVFGQTAPGPARYSPAACMGIQKKSVFGQPDEAHVSTSFVERSNLTVRMGMRRYTRLTNGFSKKLENHVAMTTIFFVYYNYCRIHQTIKVTPAMEAGLTDWLWEIEDLVALLG
jgi:hypothetical protein